MKLVPVVDYLRTRLDQAQFVRHLVREIMSLRYKSEAENVEYELEDTKETAAAQVSCLEKHLEDAGLQRELEIFRALAMDCLEGLSSEHRQALEKKENLRAQSAHA